MISGECYTKSVQEINFLLCPASDGMPWYYGVAPIDKRGGTLLFRTINDRLFVLLGLREGPIHKCPRVPLQVLAHMRMIFEELPQVGVVQQEAMIVD